MSPPDIAQVAAAAKSQSRGWRGVIDWIATINEVAAVFAIGFDLIVTCVNTILRFVTGNDIFWAPDFEAAALSAVTFLGCAAYIHRGTGMAFTALIDHVSPGRRQILSAIGLWSVILICLATLYGFPTFFASESMQRLPAIGLNEGWVAVWLGIAFVLIALYTIEKLAPLGWVANGWGIGTAGAAVAIITTAWRSLPFLSNVSPLLLMLVAFVASFATGVSIPFAIALPGLVFALATGIFPLASLSASFQGALIGNPLLIAIPFFMITGVLMEMTGMARKLVDTIQAWIGQLPGGLLHTEILAMYVFSGVSGSKSADVAAVGSVLKGPLRERGYPPAESVAVLSAAAAMGEAIPPSIALLVLASVTTLSVASLFLAGLGPTAVLMLTLHTAVYIRGRAGKLPHGDAFHLGRAVAATPAIIPALLVPVIIVGGIIGGISTPTEASSFAVVYGLIIAALVYRTLHLWTLWELLRDSVLLSGIVLFMVSTANLLTKVLVVSGLGHALTSALTSLGGQTWFLVLSTASVIILGFVLEGLPAILIAAPLLIPIAVHLRIDPLQFGIILVMATGIGVFAPPIGIGYYVACAVGEAPIGATMRFSLFYNIFLVLGLAIVLAFPEATLWLPRLFGFH